MFILSQPMAQIRSILYIISHRYFFSYDDGRDRKKKCLIHFKLFGFLTLYFCAFDKNSMHIQAIFQKRLRSFNIRPPVHVCATLIGRICHGGRVGVTTDTAGYVFWVTGVESGRRADRDGAGQRSARIRSSALYTERPGDDDRGYIDFFGEFRPRTHSLKGRGCATAALYVLYYIIRVYRVIETLCDLVSVARLSFYYYYYFCRGNNNDRHHVNVMDTRTRAALRRIYFSDQNP